MMPKKSMNVKECQLNQFYKLTNNKMVFLLTTGNCPPGVTLNKFSAMKSNEKNPPPPPLELQSIAK